MLACELRRRVHPRAPVFRADRWRERSERRFILNSGDTGLLRSLDKIPAADASRAVNDGATIAAHAQHVRYGLSLMNRWASEGGNPFADAKWEEAWKLSHVNETGWEEIRGGLRAEAQAG